MFAILVTSAAGAAACLALGLVVRLFGRLGAADRHENLSLAIALALLMPVLVLAMPASLRIDLPSRFAARSSVEESVAHGDLGPAAARTSGAAATSTTHAEPTRATAARPAVVDATVLVLGVWALGTLFFAFRLARSGLRAARIRGRSRVSGEDEQVVVSSEVRVPMVTGILRPIIVLPADAPSWTEEDVALTLLHERAHIARNDVAKQWAASIACALYWFNPLTWIVARTMASDREHAVDAMVLARGGRASTYASLLLRVAVRAEKTAVFAAFHAPAVGRADLTRRVEAILSGPTRRASRLRRAACALATLLAAVGVACSQGPAPSPSAPDRRAASPSAANHDMSPSKTLLERALGGASALDASKQAAAEETVDAWLAQDDSVLRAHVIAMELPSGLVVAVAGRDRATGPTMGIERNYPPGSTIKPIVLAAALDAGVVKRDDVLDGEHGSREIKSASGKTSTMTDVTPLGTMSLAKMLAVSSNVGASKVGERLAGTRLFDALDAAGLFSPIDGITLAQPSRPSVEADAWHRAIVSIGHGFNASPLRMVAAFGALASGGEVVSPRLRPDAPRSTRRFVSAESARAVTSMLESVVSEEGTGSLARVEHLRVAGKTGTADLEDGILYASFVGIFPADAPRYVVLVGAETRSGNGGHTAAPRFASLVNRAFR